MVTGHWQAAEKTGYPLGLEDPGYIIPDQGIQYMIHFKNTGSDTASQVIVRDTLDQNLNIFTLETGTSSHPYTFTMQGPRVLEWRFNNINLPPESINNLGSQGFLTFRAEQNPNLTNGTQIYNRADIYYNYADISKRPQYAPLINLSEISNTNQTLHTINDQLKNPNAIPLNLTIQNKTLIDGQDTCYNATSTITVAGFGTTVDITSGAAATFVAGEAIVLKPGFHSHLGSTTRAYITTTGDYCSKQQPMVASNDVTNVLTEIIDKENIVNVYPNPTTGMFTIDFLGKKTSADVVLVNFQGKQIITHKCDNQLKMSIDISHLQAGIYIIIITTGKKGITNKIIKNH